MNRYGTMKNHGGGPFLGAGLARFLRALIAVLALSLGAGLACSDGDDADGDRCPPGAEYDSALERCVSDTTPMDAGHEDVSSGQDGDSDLDGAHGDADDSGHQNEPDDAENDPDIDAADPGDEDVGQGEPPGTCEGQSLAERIGVVTVGEAGFSTRLYATNGPDDGAFIALAEGGDIRVEQVQSDGAIVDTHLVEGDDIYGLAANDEAFALLVFRQTDILALVIVEHGGTVIHDEVLIGDVDHDVEGNEWFGHQIRDGRLTEADGQWAAYYTVQSLWSDGVAHYGDQLRLFEADGADAPGGWSWGCSHSMELRIAHNGDNLGPLCASDCYPSKGIHFNHNGGKLWPDEGGSDCLGGYGTSLGASVPVEGGFWMVFTATDERDSHDVAIHRIDGWSTTETQWLTDDEVDAQHLNAARYGSNLLVAWSTGGNWNESGTMHFTEVSRPEGSVIAGPVEVPDADLSGASDFFTYDDGDIGWAQIVDGQLELARLPVCD